MNIEKLKPEIKSVEITISKLWRAVCENKKNDVKICILELIRKSLNLKNNF